MNWISPQIPISGSSWHRECSFDLSMLRWIVLRDLILAWRRRADVLSTLFFFMIVVSLFPLGIGPETQFLKAIAPGVVWVAALLASMLSLGRFFANDHQDGTLEQMLLTPQPLYLVVLGKVFAQWYSRGSSTLALLPILGLQFALSEETLLILTLTLLIGTPVLSLIGSIGAGLTLGLRGSGVLISILVLPLYVPVLIFGAGAVEASIMGSSPMAQPLSPRCVVGFVTCIRSVGNGGSVEDIVGMK